MLLMNEIIERAGMVSEVMEKDPLLSEKLKLNLDNLLDVSKRLARSSCQKFFLSDSAVAALASLTAKDVMQGEDLLRPCFDNMWIEYNSGALLLKYEGETLKYKGREKEGFLIERTEKDRPEFDVTFIEYSNVNRRFRSVVMRIDSVEVLDRFINHGLDEKFPKICGGDENLFPFEGELLDTFVYRRVGVYLLRALLFLNTPRLTEVTESEDFIALNKKRVRQGKPPLVTYRIVDLSKDMKHRVRESEEHEKLHGKAFHYVRGHFKYLNHANVPGLYWWSPHVAGSKEFGTVHKAYVHGKPPNESDSIH